MPRKRKTRLRLTAGELELLEVLWAHAGVTISQAQAALGREIGYTTVQTRLNRLVEKGVAARSEERPARYSAAVSSDEVSRDDLDSLLDRVTSGRVVPLIAHLVRDRNLSAAELEEIRRLINEAEERNQGGTGA
jgi:BlaI family transcriptional regulator, penicillinase repressor